MRFPLAMACLAGMTLPRFCLGAVPSLSEFTAVLATVPSCALPCLTDSATKSNCSAIDTQCVCADRFEQITKLATPCVLDACSVVEALFTQNATAVVCNRPIRDKSTQYNILNLSMSVATMVVVVVRLLYKQFWSHQTGLAPDDWVILATFIIGIPCTVLNTAGVTAHGLGRDVWTIPPATLMKFGEYFYVIENFYLAEMSLIKVSISLFYLPIFPGKRIHRLMLGTCIFNGVVGVMIVLIGIFACTPVSRYWMHYLEKNSPGHCIDLHAVAWIHSALNIALDVWMIALPLSQVKTLHLHWKKKVGVVVMFLMGTFITIITIVRLQSLIHFANTTNPTWDNYVIVWWSTIEVNTGMLCACLPTMRLILVRIAPRIFSTNGSRNESRLTPNAQDVASRDGTARRPVSDTSSCEMGALEGEKWENRVLCAEE